ncbi:MAG: hypothetical protein SGPRY_008893 [Prymnesium sp.]
MAAWSHPRVHLVCPINGACTAVALALCALLDAGCLSDFGCLTNQSLRRAFRAMAHASSAEQALQRWERRGSLLLKSTISTETAHVLRSIATDEKGIASGFFTHQILYLRDPVRQYLSQRRKDWCDNCGGFAEKFEAQEATVRACLAARVESVPQIERAVLPPSCPFHAVLFETDVLYGNFSALLRMLRLPNNTSRLLSASLQSRRLRNLALGIKAKHVAAGNAVMHKGHFWQPSRARHHGSWNCAVASRVRLLLPTGKPKPWLGCAILHSHPPTDWSCTASFFFRSVSSLS